MIPSAADTREVHRKNVSAKTATTKTALRRAIRLPFVVQSTNVFSLMSPAALVVVLCSRRVAGFHLITLSALAARSAESTKNIVLLGFTFSSSVTFSTWYRSHVTLLVLGVNEQRETKVAFPPSSIFTENSPSSRCAVYVTQRLPHERICLAAQRSALLEPISRLRGGRSL